MSETCPILTLAHLDEEKLRLSPEEQAEYRTRTGKAVGLVDLRVVDEQMREVPHDGESVGEIVVRAPWLTRGYLKDRKNSEKLWEGGWLHTGDIASIDQEGYVKIRDRAKDVIKISGEWVSSLELEDLIGQHPGVHEVAVIGKPHEKWGEVPLALVVPKEGTRLGEKELQSFLRDYVKKGILARESVLIDIRIVGSIDKTSVGKINKKALREKYA